MTSAVRPRWLRVTLAAARLAAFYVLGVAVLLPLLAAISGETPLSWIVDPETWVPLGVLLALAFAVLAVARRAGFVILWLLLIGVWALGLRYATLYAGFTGPFLQSFVLWTTFALPLYTMGALGVPGYGTLPLGARRLRYGLFISVLWALQLVAAVYFTSRLDDVVPVPVAEGAIVAVAPFVWGPMPFLIGGIELVRIWVTLGAMSRAQT